MSLLVKLAIVRPANDLPYIEGTYSDGKTAVWGNVKTDRGGRAMLTRWSKQNGLVVTGDTALRPNQN